MSVNTKISETLTVDKMKIIELKISTGAKKIEFLIGYGYEDTDGKFIPIRYDRKEISGNDFTTLATTIVTTGSTLYDNIAAVAYGYLLQ